MDIIGIIPARYASTRFPGKPLANIAGIPMIQRVYTRVASVLGYERTWVATDNDRIFNAVKAFGGNAVMTSPDHCSGTDRCFEAYKNIGLDCDVIINIQGDEPFIHPEQIKELARCFDREGVQLATLVRKFDAARGYDELANPNTPKVVLSDDMNALYFSRSVIPYVRGAEQGEWPGQTQYYTHVGMYGYSADALQRIVALPRSPLEKAESLEQLRWLQAGMSIAVAVTDYPTIGIDTPADLEAAERYLKQSEGHE